MMCLALVRFILKGWIYEFYVQPTYHFTYVGLEWITPPAPPNIYLFYGFMLGLTLMIALGFFFRPAILLFFLMFTYSEFWDKTFYLNHYYLISLLSFLMAFLPMNAVASWDSIYRKKQPFIPRINGVTLLKIQLGTVYFFGGIAKIGYDWLVLGQPLKIWFSANEHVPVIGAVLNLPYVPLIVSWAALLFDLTAPFLLFNKVTRPWIYPVVILFHTLTALLFPIGMFPWFMCAFSLLFFDAKFHRRVMEILFRKKNPPTPLPFLSRHIQPVPGAILFVFFLFQMLMPFRAWLYPGNPLWHEQGFRFSWRIMLMEKNGYVEYEVKVKETGETFGVHPSQFLTQKQVQQMSFQPDMILQFAHYLRDYYQKVGLGETEIRVEAYVSLNGRGSRPLVDSSIDLAVEKEGWAHKKWITTW